MASNISIFIAGVGTTFAMLALGFGGGLMLANESKELPARAHAVTPSLPPVRVIFPAPAEAATASQSSTQTAEAAPPLSQAEPVREVQQAPERDKRVDPAERRKLEAEKRSRRKKLAERKAKREAQIAMKRQEQQQRPMQQPAIILM